MGMNICMRMRWRRNRTYRTVQVLVLIAMLVYLLISLSTFEVGHHRMKSNVFGNVGSISHHLARSKNVSRTAKPENNLTIPTENHNGKDREKSRVAQSDERLGMMPTTSADPSWKRFLEGISVDAMYSRSPSYMRDFLLYMNRATIVNVTAFNWGTQFKLLMRFEDGNEVVAKPMRHPRDFYWAYDMGSQGFWLDEERHTAEIAAFHLDSILGFRKVIPCVGRKVNFTAEILHNTEDPNILGTLKKIEGGNCFIGNCKPWFCNEQHPICDHDGFMELSMCFRIPGEFLHFSNRWSQGIPEAKIWKNKNVCKDALQKPDNLEGRFFLDTMEVALFDHLIVNYDRHSHVKYTGINSEQSSVVILDNGKGFGNPYKDDLTFLAPIYQCCRFRNSTYQHLLSLSNHLGDLMKASLSTDPLAPVLTDPFFPALDRRLNQFYRVMEKCLEAYGPEVVLVEKLSPP